MKHHVFIFLGTFAVGAAIAFVARAAWHDPYGGHVPAVASGSKSDATAVAIVSPTASGVDHGSGHSGHGMQAPVTTEAEAGRPAADEGRPVNTVCAICGMKVNPKVPTETYRGRTVGFGCGACPAQFRAHPDKYGPAALRNEVVED